MYGHMNIRFAVHFGRVFFNAAQWKFYCCYYEWEQMSLVTSSRPYITVSFDYDGCVSSIINAFKELPSCVM